MTLYNLDASVSLEKLYQSFVTFGDVKDIRTVPGRPNARLIEFYDGAALECSCVNVMSITMLASMEGCKGRAAVAEAEDLSDNRNDNRIEVSRFIRVGDPNASLQIAVRHATAAYQALSQGVASKRRTKSFDMSALPSVPELNASAIPSRNSQGVRPPAGLDDSSGAMCARCCAALPGRHMSSFKACKPAR